MATTFKRGQAITSVHQHIARIQAGLSYHAVENLQKALHIPLETMASVLGMSRATLHRRKNQGRIEFSRSAEFAEGARYPARDRGERAGDVACHSASAKESGQD